MENQNKPTVHDLLAKLVAIETKIDALTSLYEKASTLQSQNSAPQSNLYRVLAEGRPWKGGKAGAFYFAKREADGTAVSIGISANVAHNATFSKGDILAVEGDIKSEEFNGETRYSMFARHVILHQSAYQQAAFDNAREGDADMPF